MRQHTTQKTSQPCPLAFSLHTAYLSIHWPYFHIPILRRKVVSKAPDVELVEHLYWAAHDRMGFDAAQRSDMVSTVEALKRIPLGQA
jgi:hypothetical protein